MKVKEMLTVAVATTVGFGFWSCSNDDDGTPAAQPAVQLTNNATLGQVLTDAEGNTLYFFSNDTQLTSECTGGCIEVWPIFHAEDLTLGTGLVSSDFSTITRADGSQQTTYQGWPLYYFVNDETPGDTNGENVNNVWFVAKPDYTLMYANAQLIGNDGLNYLGDYNVGEGNTNYIVNIAGRTMYTFTPDRRNTNNFTAEDFSNNNIWPIVELTLDQIPSVLNRSDFGQINVFGRTQLTYKGWPLYYFGQDTQRGDNKGVSVPQPGVWPVANVDIDPAPES